VNDERSSWRLIWLARSLAGIAGLCLIAGAGIVALLVVESRRPEQGAEMVLIGVPPVASIMVLAAIALLVIRFTIGRHLTGPERVVMLTLSVVSLIPWAILFVLG